MSPYRTPADMPEEEKEQMSEESRLLRLGMVLGAVLVLAVGGLGFSCNHDDNMAKVETARLAKEQAREEASRAMWEHMQPAKAAESK